MMILDEIRPLEARLTLVELDEKPVYGSRDAGEVEDLLHSMGFYFSLDERIEASPAEPETSWGFQDGYVIYRAAIPHDPNAMHWIDPYVAAVLATYGPRALQAVSDLRLAAYELCRNVVDHGIPQRPDSRILLTFVLSEHRLEVQVEDHCQAFDPTCHDPGSNDRRVVERKRRGYGLSLVRSVVDEFRHEVTATGNRTLISKDVP